MWVGGFLRIDVRTQAQCNVANLGALGLMLLPTRSSRVSRDSYTFNPTLTLKASRERLCVMIQTQAIASFLIELKSPL